MMIRRGAYEKMPYLQLPDTLSAEDKSHDICPVCYWEDDGSESEMPTCESVGGPNNVSVDEARRNYKKFGACSKEFVPNVRKPKPWEK